MSTLKLRTIAQDWRTTLKENQKNYFSWLMVYFGMIIFVYFFSFKDQFWELEGIKTRLATLQQQMSSQQYSKVRQQQETLYKAGQSVPLAMNVLYGFFDQMGIELKEVRQVSTKEYSLPLVMLRLSFTVNDRQWMSLVASMIASSSLLLSDFQLKSAGNVEMEWFVLLDQLKGEVKSKDPVLDHIHLFCSSNQSNVLSLSDFNQWAGKQSNDIKITTYPK